MKYLKRKIEASVSKALRGFPVVAILGPRQCGKSTMAKHLMAKLKDGMYLDLERPSDLAKLKDPEWFLSSCRGKLVCLDEIQRMPELFTVIRSLVDDWGGNGHFIVLGSASRDLLRQSSETLAGRISYNHKELRALGVQAGDELEIIARPKTKHTSDTTVVKTANVLLDRYDQDFKNLAQR